MRMKNIYLLLLSGLLLFACREAYLPPVITDFQNFLVIEGIVKAGGDTSYIKLTRTRSLDDTTTEIAESNATITLQAKSGVNYVFQNKGNGNYQLPPTTLSTGETYRMLITTTFGDSWESDYVPVKITPAIDSVSWTRDSGININVSTKDPTGNTRFYRWDFNETWEYNSYYDGDLGYDFIKDSFYYLDSSQITKRCWQSFNSNDILLATSKGLSQDVIANQRIQIIPKGSDKMSVRYSIMVNQYALTQQAFEYWQLVRKNSRELGSIFGTQPAELFGNFRCTSQPTQAVVGYLSISTISSKRLFIRQPEVPNWQSGTTFDQLCKPLIIDRAILNVTLQQNRNLWLAYFVGTGFSGVALADKICIDCTLRGGTNKKPSFW